MANTFEILNGFLARFGNEGEGHEAHKLSPETAARLRLFANGELSEADQKELVRQLSEQPDWVAALAAEVRELRDDEKT